MGKTAWACHCLAPQLVPSWTSSERTFEQCSPSPKATAPTGPCTHSKSQEATIHLQHRQTSELGRIIRDARTIGPIQATLRKGGTTKLGRIIVWELRAMLAIAAWEKGASRRAQGWAGEKNHRTDRTMQPLASRNWERYTSSRQLLRWQAFSACMTSRGYAVSWHIVEKFR
jgi:hypothetical protein